MERVLLFMLEWAGPIGIGLCLLTIFLWHRFVTPITFPWRVRMEWRDVEAERAREHARRSAELKEAAKWQEAREARERQLFTVVKGRRQA